MMFLFIAVPAFISFVLGWWGRGHWNKAGRKVDELIRTPHHQPVTGEEWAQIERQAHGEERE